MRAKDLFFITIFFVALLLQGCSSGAVITRATGFAYEMIVVMDNSKWEGLSGEVIQDELLAAIPGLPQPEPSFKVTHVAPPNFNGLLTYVRNILIVRIDPTQYTKVSINTENNRWSNGQVVMYLTSPDEESLVEWHKSNNGHITDFFTRVEMDRAAQQLQSTYSMLVLETVQEMFDAYLKVPSDMTYSKKGEDFFWASNNANTGRTDLIVYSFPYTDADTFTPEYLVAKRDSILEVNLPGAFPGSYMGTETRFDLSYIPITINGQYVGVLRGLWKMMGGDMMGGPFVSHVRLDERHNRVLVAEGFVYAPETNKRNFIRRIEAALYTLRLQGEAQ